MTKLEKYWRSQSGIKKSSIKAGSKASKDDEKAPPDHSSKAATNELLEKAAEIKKFLQKNDCYNLDLLAVLSDHGMILYVFVFYASSHCIILYYII